MVPPTNLCFLCQKRPGKDEGLHRIPKNPNVRHAWIAFCNLDENIDDISKVLICSKHFLATDYIEPRARELGNNLILKRGVIPSILKPHMRFNLITSSKQDVNMNLQHNISQSDLLFNEKASCSSQELTSDKETPKKHKLSKKIMPDEETEMQSHNLHESSLNPGSFEQSQSQFLKTPKRARYCQPRFVRDIKSPHLSTPRSAKRCLNLAKQTISHQKLKIRSLQQKNRNFIKRIKHLDSLIEHLKKKNLISESSADTQGVFAQMEADNMPNPRLQCPFLSVSVPELKVDYHEGKGSDTVLGENVLDLYSKCNGEESSEEDKFVDSSSIGRIKIEKEELDLKESDLCLEESSYIKCETRTFKKIQVKSNDRNIDNAFDNDLRELCTIKIESNDVKEVATKELNYSPEIHFKSEFIEQSEIHIKDEDDIKDSPNEKIQIPGKQAVLHQCPECLYKTTNKYHFKRHSLKHNKGNEVICYRCQECPYKTSRRDNFKAHTETHNGNNSILKCLKCSYETFKPTSLKNHQIKHKPNVQWLHCSECSFKTHQPCRLKSHLLAHKSDAFKCTKCSYHSRTKRQLTIHQVKHESVDKWYSCPLCPYKTYNKKTFKRHCLQQHNIDPNNPMQTEIFKCSECSYRNGCKYNVRKHKLIHDQSGWLQCPDCIYKTPHKYALQCHIMKHKSADEIQWFECSQCSLRTAYKKNLTRHQLNHKEVNEWFCCYECFFKTRCKKSLVTHILSKHKKQINKSQ